jgi:thiol:disulfide interchange protein DsbA
MFIIGLLLGTAAWAQRVPLNGQDYFELNPPQATDSPGKVEVTEFFWYRCPHCYALEPSLEPWVKRLPKDAQFKRVPAIFNDDWAIDGRVYYALESLGEVERLHKQLFDAIHTGGANRLSGDAYAKWVADWVGKHGVDPKKYDAAYNSFTVSTKLKRARQMTQTYHFDGVPALAVQGRYVVNASNDMLTVADYLIGESRKTLKQ